MFNLEPLAATAAAEMANADADAKAIENTITKALMVLSEQGVYAFGLFLATRKEKESRSAKGIHRAVASLLAETKLAEAGKHDMRTEEYPGYYKELTESRRGEDTVHALQRLLLTKQLLETALTYGRYHAKSRPTT